MISNSDVFILVNYRTGNELGHRDLISLILALYKEIKMCSNKRPPFRKCHAPGALIRNNMVYDMTCVMFNVALLNLINTCGN